MLGPSGHADTFVRDNLPPFEEWPAIDLKHFQYPEWLNAGFELTDRMVERGFGERVALIGHGRRRTYRELTEWTNRLAHALVDDLGVEPGNRVLIRSGNNPAMVACWLAVTKVGAVAVNTMPMLRAGELAKIVDKAQIAFALCDARLSKDIETVAESSRFLKHVVTFDGTSEHDAELDRLAIGKSASFVPPPVGRDDVALLGFTSGSTGVPKATMHFHRDLLIIADAYAKEVLQVRPDDVFAGSPPLAFTFGLGGLVIFPLRFGAASVLVEDASPAKLVDIIRDNGVTITFTAPTAYRAMLGTSTDPADFASLRIAVSAGETLPVPIYEEWTAKTGKPILDGIGGTEMLHIFISNRLGEERPGITGRPLRGYEAKIVDDEMQEVPRGTVGHLVVRGPIGCRYLADARQRDFVQGGWNLTGDAFVEEEDGCFSFRARTDDMIVSSGYNIAAPEVETALLSHAAVRECAVIGRQDETRGNIVEAHVTLVPGAVGDDQMVKALQNHVKATIAPYKYPRSIVFVDDLPKTESGKVQRFRLRSPTPSAGPKLPGL